MKKQDASVSIIAGWGSEQYDVVSGVVGPGHLVVKVESPICSVCTHALGVGDLVALVTRVDKPDSVLVYHLDCLPDYYMLSLSSKQGGAK